MINEFSGVGKVEFLGCLGTDVKKQRTLRVWTLGPKPQTPMIKQRAKDSFNLTVLNDII